MFQIIFLTVLRILSNSLSGVFQKKLALKYSAYLINFICYFLLSIICLFSFKYFKFESFSIFIYALLVGLIGALGNSFQIKALEEGELSVLAPINSFKIIFSLIFSLLILSEIPNYSALVGIFMILFASCFLFDTTKEGFSFALFKRKDIQYRFAAVFMTALEAIFIKKLILLSNVQFALFLWAFASCLFSFLFIKEKKEVYRVKNLNMFLCLTLTMAIMQFSTNILFKIMNVSYALSLFQLSSILSVVLGWKIFKEKNVIKKLIATTVMIIGAVIIILTNG